MNSMNALLWPNKAVTGIEHRRMSTTKHIARLDLTAFRSSVASLRVELAVYRYGENASDGLVLRRGSLTHKIKVLNIKLIFNRHLWHWWTFNHPQKINIKYRGK